MNQENEPVGERETADLFHGAPTEEAKADNLLRGPGGDGGEAPSLNSSQLESKIYESEEKNAAFDPDDDLSLPPALATDSTAPPVSRVNDNESSPSSIDSQASSFGMLVDSSKASSFEMLVNSLDPTVVDAREDDDDDVQVDADEEEASSDVALEATFAIDDSDLTVGLEAATSGDAVPIASAEIAGAGGKEDEDDAEKHEEDEGECEMYREEVDMEGYESHIRQLESLDDVELPRTVARLKTQSGTRIFLVGTAHFSNESQEDVSTTIRAVEPDIVMVELCYSRERVLRLDEETILRESNSLNSARILQMIKEAGFLQGISYVLLLNLSAHITKKLGMAPGGEFRRAFRETKLLRERKKTKIYLGDRPVRVTLKRALAMLSIWQKLHLCWSLLTEKLDISKEDIEKMKQKDILETLLQEMAKDYPTLAQVFVQERDIWLAHALSVAEKMAMHDARQLTVNGVTHVLPSVVVGVVGIGHQPGIIEEWRKIEESQLSNEEKSAILMELVKIPPPSLASRILGFGFRAAKLTLMLWTCHKIYKWVYPPP